MMRIISISSALFVATSLLAEPKVEMSIYSPNGKRDPFQGPSSAARDISSVGSPLEKYTLDQFELKAILKGPRSNQILVQDPTGASHILTEGATLGRGNATISRILDTEVIFTERRYNYLGTESIAEKVLSISKEPAPAK
jgi:Tfp pilus assembly protein PilP